MREIRQSGSEGGGNEINRSFLPLSHRGSVLDYYDGRVHPANNIPQLLRTGVTQVFMMILLRSSVCKSFKVKHSLTSTNINLRIR